MLAFLKAARKVCPMVDWTVYCWAASWDYMLAAHSALLLVVEMVLNWAVRWDDLKVVRWEALTAERSGFLMAAMSGLHSQSTEGPIPVLCTGKVLF